MRKREAVISISCIGFIILLALISPLHTRSFIRGQLNKEQVAVVDTQALEEDINYAIKSAEQENTAINVSVYFEDLNRGNHFAINKDEKYAPGSLLKVATLMSYLKLSENDPGILFKVINADILDRDYTSSHVSMPHTIVIQGMSYTVNDLLKTMIIDSDNNAVVMLNKNVGEDILLNTYKELNLPVYETNLEYITVNQIASLFINLNNSRYLNEASSEEALSLLKQSRFTLGIRHSLPQDIPVAIKYGEDTIGYKGIHSLNELHDCGIVYYPNNPYVLCVMTKGAQFEDLEKVIQAISGVVYNKIHSSGQ
jgi:beta-lactamase class A